jgi:hypothetical protein
MLNNKRGSLGHTKMSYRICNDAPNRTKINTGEKNPFFHKNLQWSKTKVIKDNRHVVQE